MILSNTENTERNYKKVLNWPLVCISDARIRLVFANPVGEATDARNKIAILVAAFMANVRTAHVYVWPDGMAFIVL